MTAEQTGRRIQETLDALAGSGAEQAGEQLVRDLMEFYGGGWPGSSPRCPRPSWRGCWTTRSWPGCCSCTICTPRT